MLFKLNFIIIEYRMKVICVNKHTAITGLILYLCMTQKTIQVLLVLFFESILFNNSERLLTSTYSKQINNNDFYF